MFPFLRKFSVARLLALFVVLFIAILSVAFLLDYFNSPSFGLNTHNNFVWQGLIYINPVSRLPEFVLGIIGYRIVYSEIFFNSYGILNRNSSYRLKLLSKILSSVSIFLFFYLIFHGFNWGVAIPVQLMMRILSSASCLFLIVCVATCQGPLVQFLERPFMVALGRLVMEYICTINP